MKKTMHFIYLLVFILAVVVVVDGNSKISNLNNNVVVSQFNSTHENYKIVKVNDTTTDIEFDKNVISLDYTFRVIEEADKSEYIKLANSIISSTKLNSSGQNIGKININFVSKKGNVLLHNVLFNGKK